ncbi:energy transducer TonB [Mucilaginibacter ginsenosidivorax]|uniref:TonB family protein n=1 Tax=Mucilaginibacter ginsenosidivorax TaxID=862126 RepID=A0A5B8VW52_9SPHI|nr:energy transducer TonB [Mucilaginibacter ginsenosidivorax]QEC74438.1 TonB family protein [Mucilaginibacter ginsenosidivorax]
MKKLIRVLLLLNAFVTNSLFAQKDTVMLYMQDTNNGYSFNSVANGQPATKKEDATFIRVLLSPAIEGGLNRVNDYYLSGKLKFSGESSSPSWYPRFDGTCVSYFENGHKKGVYHFDKGRLTGDVIEYFPNGRVNTVKTISDGIYVNSTGMPGLKLTQCLDSVGNVLADGGDGKWLEYHGGNFPFAEGMVKKGVEDGDWHGKLNDTISYTCKYDMGVLKEGKSISTKGNTHLFTQIQSLPEFPGGQEKLIAYIGRTLAYPADAREKGIQGRVLVQFTVQTDGSLTDIQVVRSLYPSLDEQALNCLRKSPKWTSGYKYGIKTAVVYTIPVSFALAYDH